MSSSALLRSHHLVAFRSEAFSLGLAVAEGTISNGTIRCCIATLAKGHAGATLALTKLLLSLHMLGILFLQFVFVIAGTATFHSSHFRFVIRGDKINYTKYLIIMGQIKSISITHLQFLTNRSA